MNNEPLSKEDLEVIICADPATKAIHDAVKRLDAKLDEVLSKLNQMTEGKK